MPELDGVKYDYTPSGIKKYYDAKKDKKKKSKYPSAKDQYADAKSQGRIRDQRRPIQMPTEQGKKKEPKVKAGDSHPRLDISVPKGAGRMGGKSKKRYYGKATPDPSSKR